MGNMEHIPMLCFVPLAFQHTVQQLFHNEMQVVHNEVRLDTDAIEFVICLALSELGEKFDIACSMILQLEATTTNCFSSSSGGAFNVVSHVSCVSKIFLV